MLEKLNKRRIKYRLVRETLMNLKKILGFKGEGTKDSPVIIDDLGDVFVEFTIKTEDIYLVLRNLNISKLRILSSQNVAIENCFVGNLKMARCRNLTFRNNSIITAQQLLYRSCFFENNRVLHKQFLFLIRRANESHEKWSGKGYLGKYKRSDFPILLVLNNIKKKADEISVQKNFNQ